MNALSKCILLYVLPCIRRYALAAGFLATVMPFYGQQQPEPQSGQHSFAVDHQQFLLNGVLFQIISGDMHYARIPRAYWRDRLRKTKAMGLNTISTYVFWNVHETRPGVFDFSGDKDAAEFVRMEQQEGLYMILRPGRMYARSGIWSDTLRGCWRIRGWNCAAPRPNSWRPPRAG